MIEDLRVTSMTASARGTIESPGKKVRQKAGLNRAILGVGFGEIRRQLEYKSPWHGRRCLAVPAAYSSQTCTVCGHVNPKNRDTQAVFRCLDCGHTANADVNAAQIIRQRGIAVLHRECELAAAPGIPGREIKARPVRRAVRRPATRTHPAVARRADPATLAPAFAGAP